MPLIMVLTCFSLFATENMPNDVLRTPNFFVCYRKPADIF